MARQKRTSLDELLRLSRREAPPEFVAELTRSLASSGPAGGRPATGPRALLRTAVVTALVVGGLVAVGGLGYAMTVATDAIVKVVQHKTYARQVVLRHVFVNAAADQYGT